MAATRASRCWMKAGSCTGLRGPRTALALGLPRSLGLGDPAMLLPRVVAHPPECGAGIGFIPHFESAARGAWQQAAAIAGVTLIDPRGPPLDILSAIGRCSLVLSEAMHGIIVADALRVPWVAIQPLARIHRAKWQDWAETVDMVPRFTSLPASNVPEWAWASALGGLHTARLWLGRNEHVLAEIATERLVAQAGRALGLAARTAPQLSPDSALDRCQSRMLDAVAALRRQPRRAAAGAVPNSRLSAVPATHRPSRLRGTDDSAYQLELIG
jgi:succinoglycan biosynthesis protein ExoV